MVSVSEVAMVMFSMAVGWLLVAFGSMWYRWKR